MMDRKPEALIALEGLSILRLKAMWWVNLKTEFGVSIARTNR